MKRATITMTEELAEALEAYCRDQETPSTLTTVAEAALREYLASRGYLSTAPRLRITPADRGSGRGDVSASHDQYLAER